MNKKYRSVYLPFCYQYLDSGWLAYLLTFSYRKNEIITNPNPTSHRFAIEETWHQRHRFQYKLNSHLVKNVYRKSYLLPRSIAFIDYDFSRKNCYANSYSALRPHTHEIMFIHPKIQDTFLRLSDKNFTNTLLKKNNDKDTLVSAYVENTDPIGYDEIQRTLSYITKFIDGPTAIQFGSDASLHDMIGPPTSDRKRRFPLMRTDASLGIQRIA